MTNQGSFGSVKVIRDSISDLAEKNYKIQSSAIQEDQYHEAVVASSFCSPYIVRMFPSQLEYCQGRTSIKPRMELHQADAKRARPTLSSQALRKLLAHITLGLHYLHERGYIHRDIKPANIMVKNSSWVIIDLGFLARATSLQPTRFSLAGTQFVILSVLLPFFQAFLFSDMLAPETWSTFRASPAGDIYALGATLTSLIAPLYFKTLTKGSKKYFDPTTNKLPVTPGEEQNRIDALEKHCKDHELVTLIIQMLSHVCFILSSLFHISSLSLLSFLSSGSN